FYLFLNIRFNSLFKYLSDSFFPNFFIDRLYKIAPSRAHTIIIIHSGVCRAEGIPGIYNNITPIDIIRALILIVLPPFRRNCLSIFGSVFLKTKNEAATNNQATTNAKPPASTNHSKAGRPNKGASVVKDAINTIAL